MKKLLALSLWVSTTCLAQSPGAQILVLEKDQGEKRVRRPREKMPNPTSEFILKVTPQNSSSRFLSEFRERLVRFGLELHPDKTRLIEFGRFAVRNRKQRGEGKPETFTFPGFTHFCGNLTSSGAFNVWRTTAKMRWSRSSISSRQSLNNGSIIARVKSVHGFGRLCRATTNTMLCRVTPVSCASSGVACADCGGTF